MEWTSNLLLSAWRELDTAYREAIEALNDDPGWTFDVRYDTQEYISSTDFTRVAGRSLRSAELNAAGRLADEWLRGDWSHADRVPKSYYA